MRKHSPNGQDQRKDFSLARKERMLLWSTFIFIMTQNVAVIAFFKFLEHKDKAWFEVSSSLFAAFVYRLSLIFAGLM